MKAKFFIVFFQLLFFLSLKEVSSFDYDLHLYSIPGKNDRTMVCFHGYGGNYAIARLLKSSQLIDATLVSFNFPDYDLRKRPYSPQQSSFGTIHELLPALLVLKHYVIEQNIQTLDLYGYSAGGGAVVNVLALLNGSLYEEDLESIGIRKEEKIALLQAIQRGIILLDVPLKSVEENIALRGANEELEIIAQHYSDNHLRPIDNIDVLNGLSLDVIIHFQEPDEVLSNRDDALYITKFKAANSLGVVTVTKGYEGGHQGPHWPLLECYVSKVKSTSP